jgi:hypothetical protein
MSEPLDEHAGHTPEMRSPSAGGGKRAGPTQARNHGGHDHAQMVADFRRRFWISLALTIPILALSHDLWDMLGLAAPVAFRGDAYVLFGFSSIVFFYGGWPFLKGFGDELRQRRPGMMTLIAVAISAAYFYSSAVTFGLPGMGFYWELATLIDIMLLGHWIEMRSVLGASGALEALVRLLPSEAHRLLPDGNIEDIPVGDVAPGDRILVKPGERVPTGLLLTPAMGAVLVGEYRDRGHQCQAAGAGRDRDRNSATLTPQSDRGEAGLGDDAYLLSPWGNLWSVAQRLTARFSRSAATDRLRVRPARGGRPARFRGSPAHRRFRCGR